MYSVFFPTSSFFRDEHRSESITNVTSEEYDWNMLRMRFQNQLTCKRLPFIPSDWKHLEGRIRPKPFYRFVHSQVVYKPVAFADPKFAVGEQVAKRTVWLRVGAILDIVDEPRGSMTRACEHEHMTASRCVLQILYGFKICSRGYCVAVIMIIIG